MRSELALKEGIVACQPLRNSDIQTLDNEKMGIEGIKSAEETRLSHEWFQRTKPAAHMPNHSNEHNTQKHSFGQSLLSMIHSNLSVALRLQLGLQRKKAIYMRNLTRHTPTA
jgi:hypothetical protein